MAKQARLYEVEEIHLSLLKSNPPQLAVAVTGYSTTAGWSAAELRSLEKTLSPDGILDIDFVATPPNGIVPQVKTRMSANLVWTDDVERIVGV